MFDSLKSQFLEDITLTVKLQEIPSELIVNWDQKDVKIMPVSSWTIEKKGTRRVEIAGSDDKHQITAIFAVTPAGVFLPPQVTYAGNKSASLPKYSFPTDWNITFKPNHVYKGQCTESMIAMLEGTTLSMY